MVYTRRLGNAAINPIGFGAMGIAVPVYGKIDSDEERFKVLDEAYANGCTHWDLADRYGDSEDLVGEWLKRTGKRDKIFLATKFGLAEGGIRGDPEYVKQQCEASLKRLGVDYIDLYYQHRVDRKTPIEVTIRAMSELVREGKVKYLGISECSASDLRRAHAVHPITTIQVEYSPLFLDIEKPEIGLLQAARELGVKIVAFGPLAAGLITGQIKSPDDFEADDYRRTVPKYAKENFPKILSLVDKIREIGDKHNATPGQIALAWILAQGDDFFVIPGTRKVKYLNENMGGASVKLSAEEIAIVRRIAEESELPGSRFGAAPVGPDDSYNDSVPLSE